MDDILTFLILSQSYMYIRSLEGLFGEEAARHFSSGVLPRSELIRPHVGHQNTKRKYGDHDSAITTSDYNLIHSCFELSRQKKYDLNQNKTGINGAIAFQSKL